MPPKPTKRLPGQIRRSSGAKEKIEAVPLRRGVYEARHLDGRPVWLGEGDTLKVPTLKPGDLLGVAHRD